MAFGRDEILEFVIKGRDDFTGVFKKFARQSEAIKRNVKRAMIAITAFTAAFVGMTKVFINAASSAEQVNVKLKVLLGSVEEGNRLFRDMSKLAAQVPFEFDQIMQSTATLAGVMEGGVDEINRWMPMILDLAAVTGLSVQETTSQIVRMYSAGAASADLFRERGVLQMLGFQAGVRVTAEETRKQLIRAFEDPASKFRGASDELAKTWVGLTSMMSDQWFQFRNQVMNSGVFAFLKSALDTILRRINENRGAIADFAQDMSDIMLKTIKNMIRATEIAALPVAALIDVWRGLKMMWLTLEVAYYNFFDAIWSGLAVLRDGVLKLMKAMNFKGVFDKMIQQSENFGNVFAKMADENAEKAEGAWAKIDEEAAKGMAIGRVLKYGDAIDEMIRESEENMTRFSGQDAFRPFSNENRDRAVANIRTVGEELEEWYGDKMKSQAADTAGVVTGTFDTLTSGIGNSVGAAITQQQELGKALKNTFKNVVAGVISGLVNIGIQRVILAILGGNINAAQTTGRMASLSAETYAAAFASTAAIPIVGPGLAPGVAAASTAAMLAGAAGAAATGAGAGAGMSALGGGMAHAGLTNVPREETFLLQRGERVVAPEQNRDLTEFLEGEGEGPAGGVRIDNLTINSPLADMNWDRLTERQLAPAIQRAIRRRVRFE